MTSKTRTAACTAAILMVACGRTPAPKAGPDAGPPARVDAPASAEDRTVLAASEAVRKYALTTLAPECVSYQFDGISDPAAYVVQVREDHDNPKCGGDPAVAPRLFTLKVDRKTGAMETDAGGIPGEFHALGAAK